MDVMPEVGTRVKHADFSPILVVVRHSTEYEKVVCSIESLHDLYFNAYNGEDVDDEAFHEGLVVLPVGELTLVDYPYRVGTLHQLVESKELVEVRSVAHKSMVGRFLNVYHPLTGYKEIIVYLYLLPVK